MTISMYQASVPVFTRMLTSCSGILAKAEAHAVRAGFDPATLLESRLAPDMFPLHRQVQIAADGARGAAVRLAGLALPDPEAEDFAVFNRGIQHRFPNTESSFAALTARLDDAIALARGPAAGAGRRVGGADGRRHDGRPHPPLRRSALPAALRAAEPALPHRHGLRHPAPRRRRLGKQDFEGLRCIRACRCAVPDDRGGAA